MTLHVAGMGCALMDSARWNQIEEIYCAALSCPPEGREALLNERCGDDLQLRQEVQSLLDADANAGSFLGLADLEAQFREVVSETRSAAPGTVLGHYCIVSEIAAGGMGEVYLAIDQRLNRRIALKVLPAEFTQDLARVRRLFREARAASSLNHPNIITVYEIGSTSGSHFIASEFIEGTTLRRLLQSEMAPIEAIRIALQCTSALDAAHRSGITHRDIKPENVMVRPDGLVKVLDFGLALQVDNSAPVSGTAVKTESGVIMGTPRYMSPEQARGQKLDPRTDIFSLGAVLYEMVAGEPPFPGATTAEVFAQLLGSEPKPLSQVRRALPRRLQIIISKAMAKDPEARYPSMAEFSADLKSLLADLERSVAVPVSGLSKSGEVPHRVKPTVRFSRQRSAYSWTAAGLLVAALLLGVAGWLLAHRPDGRSPHVVPFASFPGSKDHASFSPDGSQVAFAWDGGKPGKRDIYIKVVGSGDPLRITSSPEDEWLPAWSPDGRFIAFSRTIGGKQSIYVVPALGGQERKVADAGVGLSWWPDSRSLVLVSPPPPEGNGALMLLSLDKGERRDLTTPAPYADSLPAVSPDGEYVAFIRSLTMSTREIFMIPAGGGAARRITSDQRPVFGVTWTSDSRNLVFACNRGGGESLWRIRSSGGTPERVLIGLQSVFYPNISRKGDRLIFTEDFLDTNVYRFTGPGFGSGDSPGKFSNPESLIDSSREDSSPAFSPDGQRIAFVSKRTGSEEIWICDRDGGHLVQATSFFGPATGTPRWSPDGRFIVFDSRAGGSPDIYVIPAAGGPPRRMTTHPAADIVPSWSADGKWIYFSSNRSGSPQLWKMPASGGEATQITHTGIREALEGADGRIYFIKDAAWGIWSVSKDGSDEGVVPGLERAGRNRFWGVHPKGIYFVTKKDAPPFAVEFYSFSTHKVTTLLKLEKDTFWNQPGLCLSPDGRHLLVVAQDQHVNDLMLIEDFR
jgi:eukaryotic-like serine/threonine-protein kinase